MKKIIFTSEAQSMQGTYRLSVGDMVLALSATFLLVAAATVLLTGLLDDRTAQEILAATR